MSTLDHDGFHVDSSNPDAEAVTATLDATTPVTPESPTDAAALDSVRTSTDAAEGRPSSETPEAAEEGERERHPDGKFARKGSIQERIDKAVAAQRAAERERDALKAHWEAQQAQRAPEAPQASAEAPYDAAAQERAEITALATDPNDPEPHLDQHEGYEQWVKAQARWEARQEYREMQVRQQRYYALHTHTERIQSYAQQTPDYFEKIQAAARLPVAKVMEAAIIQSPRGPELAYFLATHPEEAIRLAQEHVTRPLSDAPFVRELLESKLTSQAASSGPASGVSRTPVFRPIKPVGATPVVAETPPDALEFGPEYVRRMNALDAQKRKHGGRY